MVRKCQRERHGSIYRQFFWTSDRSGILESGSACGVADPHIAFGKGIELCSAAAGSHPKGAIQIRNRQMVDRSDLVVFCVDHSSGGAYQTLRYAQRKKKEILNLAHVEGCG